MHTTKKEINRQLAFPDTLLPHAKDIEQLCFRKNDTDLSDIDTLFVFGSVSNLENMKKAILYILKAASISTIIISGGVTKKTAPLSEALIIFNAIKDNLPANIKIILETQAQNTKENVELSLKAYPALKKSKLCFVSKYFAAGRSFLTLRSKLPQTLIKQYAFVANDCAPKEWVQNEETKSLIWAEIMRIFTYGRRGDILYNPVKEKVEFLVKKDQPLS